MRTVALAFAISVGVAGPAMADLPGDDWMKPDEVRKVLATSGYSDIVELEPDDGRWEGEGMKNGQRMEFHADARTGKLISEKPDDD